MRTNKNIRPNHGTDVIRVTTQIDTLPRARSSGSSKPQAVNAAKRGRLPARLTARSGPDSGGITHPASLPPRTARRLSEKREWRCSPSTSLRICFSHYSQIAPRCQPLKKFFSSAAALATRIPMKNPAPIRRNYAIMKSLFPAAPARVPATGRRGKFFCRFL